MEGSGTGWTGGLLPSVGEEATKEHSVFEVAVQNGLANHSSLFADVVLLQSFKLLIIPCYALVVVVGVLGNYLLLYVICRTRKMHNVSNFFIGNLAFSDMLMCVTCVPFTLAYAFNPRGWVFGRFMCYLVFLIQPVTVYVSVFTLTAIAVDRYYATVHPLKKRTSVATCAYVLSGIWLLSCGLVAPAVAHTYHVEFREEGLTICEEFWLGQEKERLAYAYSTLLVTYVLPLSAVCVSYLCISVKLRNCVAPGHRTRDQAEAQRARKRKIFRLVALVVAAFGVCWLPIHVFNVLRDIDIRLINKRHFLLIQLMCHLCAMSSSCCNPFLYAWLHDRFRAELRKMFTCHRRIGIPANHCATASVAL
ncbi:prolactin-releasing peptide receptor-like [Oncorhynchus nerka]|uniref:Prolactin-releasing peptide receptor n=2 Tax=Oncorhynchus TaxID=8016 RepID=A0A8C7CM66_ONCKI|nr:prolactin-releasing peptide receptor-like [Oncorhynchus kisutch]XP_024289811.1 prolactin-releasing peptide receptor-like [Oncorhynchus tshawytscha]XP_029481938.1 prolactin-releasing peptide receptor-like [Oncorhynchus nerka]XP_031682277.1 prolactin-releasing peptide receptor-like [Oncorhynchus kisutch]